MAHSTICVIIPARNSEYIIEKCLRSIFSSNLSSATYEVTVIDDHSSDNTVKKIQQAFPAVKVLVNPGKGPSAARNYGARCTAAQYIAFTDSDCLVAEDWLEKLWQGFTRHFLPDQPSASPASVLGFVHLGETSVRRAERLAPRGEHSGAAETDAAGHAFVGIGGVQDIPEDESPFGRKVQRLFRNGGFLTGYLKSPAETTLREVAHNPSCCVVYVRDVFLKAGGFLENLYPGEDVELDYRLRKMGYKLGFIAGAKVYHYREKDLKSFLKKIYRYGLTQGMLVRRYGFFRLIHCLPLFLAAVMTGMVGGYFVHPLWMLIIPALIFLASFAYLGFNFELGGLAVLAGATWHAGFLRGVCLRLPRR
jgi:glycosyltransferase involved in cell wall biosynthesis